MYDEKLVTDNIKIVYYVLKKMNLYSKAEEYYDVGLIGLCKATKTFNYDKGYKFSTYACKFIKSEILTYIRNEKTDKRKTIYYAVSFDTPIYLNGIDTKITLEDTLKSDINIEEDIAKKDQVEKLYMALNNLKKKELEILTDYYGLYGVQKLNIKELCKKYKCSKTNIYHFKDRGLKKLRKLLKEKKWIN